MQLQAHSHRRQTHGNVLSQLPNKLVALYCRTVLESVPLFPSGQHAFLEEAVKFALNRIQQASTNPAQVW